MYVLLLLLLLLLLCCCEAHRAGKKSGPAPKKK
jgi:hypothetical protein